MKSVTNNIYADKYVWAKTILTAYNNIDRVIESIDRTINSIAMRGFGGTYDTYALIQEIIELQYRKTGLRNLRIIINQVFENMDKKYIELLYLRFDKKKKFADIAERMCISLRSVFRYYDKALIQFSSLIRLNVFNDEFLEKEYEEDSYISRIKKKVVDEYRDVSDTIIKREQNRKIRECISKINLIYDSNNKASV